MPRQRSKFNRKEYQRRFRSVQLARNERLWGEASKTVFRPKKERPKDRSFLEPVEVTENLDGGSTKLLVLGRTEYGQLGLKSDDPVDERGRLKEVCFKILVKQMACGLDHAHLLTATGMLYSMGSNTYGQLGIGLTGAQLPFTR